MMKNIKRYALAMLALCCLGGAMGCQEDETSSLSGNSSIVEDVSSFIEVSSDNSLEASSEETASTVESPSIEESASETSSEESSSSEESTSEDSSEDSSEGLIASAKSVVDEVLTRPDAWAFLPEVFQEENMAYSENVFPVTDFTNNTQVSSIGDRFIGAQMMVLYDGLLTMQSALEKVDVVYAFGEALASAYQKFINDNPDNYATFTTTLSGFNVKIELDGAKSTLLAGNSVLSVELYADSTENTNSGRIQVTDGVALKYEMTDDSLIYAYQVGGGEAMRTVNLSFARNEDAVAGYLYEFTGFKGVGTTTTAVFTSDDEYTKVVAKKRESDDLIVLGNEEIYSSQTGEYVSGVVSETIKLVDFETYWFNLKDVSGFNSVKVVENDEKDEVYVNGSNKIFATKNMSIVNFSRRFDVEMKTVFYVKAVENAGEISYELVETEIPMLFAQTETFEELGEDIQDKNSQAFSTAPTVTSGVADLALEDFETLKSLFETIQQLTYQSIVEYIGEKDEFFEV